ncbi:hypothetical protein CEXT_268241 [Caerostris extrusa]|uniref:Uncharacterized protein n=1 Tax=Caerostris extrusa TaxID=172846 RepID=A0AAV4W895_CAEEX|nr:hypothetical protein CEXT_268241 [Caerostris extrusa]
MSLFCWRPLKKCPSLPYNKENISFVVIEGHARIRLTWQPNRDIYRQKQTITTPIGNERYLASEMVIAVLDPNLLQGNAIAKDKANTSHILIIKVIAFCIWLHCRRLLTLPANGAKMCFRCTISCYRQVMPSSDAMFAE